MGVATQRLGMSDSEVREELLEAMEASVERLSDSGRRKGWELTGAYWLRLRLPGGSCEFAPLGC